MTIWKCSCLCAVDFSESTKLPVKIPTDEFKPFEMSKYSNKVLPSCHWRWTHQTGVARIMSPLLANRESAPPRLHTTQILCPNPLPLDQPHSTVFCLICLTTGKRRTTGFHFELTAPSRFHPYVDLLFVGKGAPSGFSGWIVDRTSATLSKLFCIDTPVNVTWAVHWIK